MAEVFAVETTIDLPVQEVWARLTDWPRAAEWMPGVESVLADGEVLTVHARGKDRTSRITAHEPGRSVTLTSAQGGVRADYAYTCEQSGSGTRVSLRADCVTSGAWFLVGGVIRAAIRKADSGQLESFKRHLKRDHGLTHGNANALAHQARERQAGGPTTEAQLLDAQYAGGKAPLRPIYDEVALVAHALGGDVEVAVKKTTVSLRRAKQFALIEARSATRVRLGLNLRGVEPTGRLAATTGMCTHAIDLTDVDDVDDEVASWLRAAYQQAG